MRSASEIWKGVSGSDRSVIVERLFALSKEVLIWKSRCASGEVEAWAWYGGLDFDVDMLREDLSQAFGKNITDGKEMVTIDGQGKRLGRFESEMVVTKLGELGTLLEEWAEACAAGKLVAWIVLGRVAEYVERIWDRICWDGREGEVEV